MLSILMVFFSEKEEVWKNNTVPVENRASLGCYQTKSKNVILTKNVSCNLWKKKEYFVL